MKRSGNASARQSFGGYLTRRTRDLASPRTRAKTDPLAQWAVRRIRLDGRPFRFEDHEYLRAIYDDTSPHVVLSKAAQVGGTTWALLRSVHACLQGLNVMYFFPTRTDVLEFSKSRVGPLLAENPFLAKQMTDTDTAGLKRIGDAHLYFRGMQSTVGMKSVPADMLVFDELDEATPEAKAMARERIAHSDYKRVIELSNPSLPGYGIDEQFELSDQRHWTLECPDCGEGTCLEKEFPKKMGQAVPVIGSRPDGTFYRACRACGGELDVNLGLWVPDFPGRQIHGYRISQLFSDKVDPGEVLSEYRTTRFPERFYNLKVGVPWADLERRLDVAAVFACCGDNEMLESCGDAAMGVDTGKELHVVIIKPVRWNEQGTDEVVHLAVCHEFGELDTLMTRFNVSCCVIDGLPETHATRAFAQRHSGSVYLNFFNESQRGSANWDGTKGIVSVNRTEALDASRAAIRDKTIVLPRRGPLVDLFARHMTADAKILDEDPDTGAKKYRYVRIGDDHFSLAFTYAWMAMQDRFLRGPIFFAM